MQAWFFTKGMDLDTLSSLVGGALAGFGLCFVFVSLVGGVQFALGGGISSYWMGSGNFCSRSFYDCKRYYA